MGYGVKINEARCDKSVRLKDAINRVFICNRTYANVTKKSDLYFVVRALALILRTKKPPQKEMPNCHCEWSEAK
jgi:hypothetical protein